VNKTTVKAHQATVEDFDESAEEPGVAMKGFVSSKTGGDHGMQDGGGPRKEDATASVLLQCVACGEIFPEHTEVDSHPLHDGMSSVVARLFVVHTGRATSCGPPIHFPRTDKSKMSMHASQAKETAFQRPELATSARRVEEITEQMKGLGEEYVRLSAELGKHQELVQAAHDQQEAMRREMEALNVQEASIAAQKKDLQTKTSK
jgi:hypothetical protein